MSTTFTRHADRPFTADPVEEADVIIVGSGFAGGLGLAMQLERDQNQSYLVLERADDVGGTWRDNTYPGGVYCDVPSHLYSYSFRPNPDWSMVRSPGHEIYEYLQTAAREEGVLPQVRFGTTVLDAAWDEVSATWLVTTNKGTFRGRFFVPAMGLLSDSKVPEIPGMETFGGELFHSAAWDHDLPLTGKRVAIIGTGATAIQLVPELAEVAAELVVFQRSAAHVLPRRNRAYTPAERRMFARVPESRQGLRSAMFWFTESTFGGERRRLPQSVAQVKAAVDSFREAEVPDQALRAALTPPDYEIGCKRLLYSDDYYATFGRDHVSLETSALARIEGNTVIGASGNAYEVDVIVMATGFAAARPPFANIIRGREGVLLADHWATGMEPTRRSRCPPSRTCSCCRHRVRRPGTRRRSTPSRPRCRM